MRTLISAQQQALKCYLITHCAIELTFLSLNSKADQEVSRSWFSSSAASWAASAALATGDRSPRLRSTLPRGAAASAWEEAGRSAAGAAALWRRRSRRWTTLTRGAAHCGGSGLNPHRGRFESWAATGQLVGRPLVLRGGPPRALGCWARLSVEPPWADPRPVWRRWALLGRRLGQRPREAPWTTAGPSARTEKRPPTEDCRRPSKSRSRRQGEGFRGEDQGFRKRRHVARRCR
jgi:hypothetical protein